VDGRYERPADRHRRLARFPGRVTHPEAVRSNVGQSSIRPRPSPLRATSEELAGLPETFLVVDEYDVLRDEGEAFGRVTA
jgi:acetyl esterase/lipase